MHFTRSIILSCVAYLIGCTNATNPLGWKDGWFPAKTDQTDRLAADSLFKFGLAQVLDKGQRNCTLANTAVRREWYATQVVKSGECG